MVKFLILEQSTIVSLTVNILIFPWQLSTSLPFTGFPDKWSPRWTQLLQFNILRNCEILSFSVKLILDKTGHSEQKGNKMSAFQNRADLLVICRNILKTNIPRKSVCNSEHEISMPFSQPLHISNHKMTRVTGLLKDIFSRNTNASDHYLTLLIFKICPEILKYMLLNNSAQLFAKSRYAATSQICTQKDIWCNSGCGRDQVSQSQ